MSLLFFVPAALAALAALLPAAAVSAVQVDFSNPGM